MYMFYFLYIFISFGFVWYFFNKENYCKIILLYIYFFDDYFLVWFSLIDINIRFYGMFFFKVKLNKSEDFYMSNF